MWAPQCQYIPIVISRANSMILIRLLYAQMLVGLRIRRCKYHTVLYADVSLDQRTVIPVNKCYFRLNQQFSDAFCISTPEICLG